MKFTLSYCRSVVGNDIDIQIEAENGHEIARVRAVLDGFELSDEVLEIPPVSYQRTYLQVGSATPHAEHKLTVAAADVNGKQETATREWQDIN